MSDLREALRKLVYRIRQRSTNKLHNREFAMTLDDCVRELAALSAQPQPEAVGADQIQRAMLREELKVSIEKRLSEGDGAWRSCSGCHETIDGWSPAPVSEIFKCQLGGGCAECGGLGAIWDSTDYSKFARFVPGVVVNALSPAGADKPTIGGTAFCGHGVMASICDKCADDGKKSEGGR